MATADTSGGEGGADASVCARDFVVDRLREADSPMAPAELASEYGCTNGHVRNLLADLMDEGVVERVGRGQYVHAEGEVPGEGADVMTDVVPDTEESAEAGEPVADEESDVDPSADGGPRSEDPATGVEEGRESGVGIPREVAVVAVVVVLAVAYWRLTRGRDQGGQEPADEQENGPLYTRGD